MVLERTRKQKIVRRTIWGVGLAAGLTAALVWTGYSAAGEPVAAIAGLLGFLGLLELAFMGKLRSEGLVGAFVAAGLLCFLVSWSAVDGLLPSSVSEPMRAQFAPRLAIFLFLVPALVALTSRPHRGQLGLVKRIGVAAVLAVWVGYPFAILHPVWVLMGHTGFVVLLVLSKVGDIAGYYVGNAIGKTHPFKGISPGKTTAGCVGSLVAGAADAGG